MDGTSGYSAWRWIFIIEGAFTTGVGILTFFVLPDWPEQARFLKDDERAILIAKLSRDTGEYVENKTTVEVLKETFTDPKILFWYVDLSQPCELLLTKLEQCYHVLWHLRYWGCVLFLLAQHLEAVRMDLNQGAVYEHTCLACGLGPPDIQWFRV